MDLSQSSLKNTFSNLLVTDFDGTMTDLDFFDRVVARFGDRKISAYWDDYVAGWITHFEALRRIFGHIRGGEPAILAIAHETGLDPNVHSAIERLKQHGWGVVVVSAGCSWYIERLLAEQGVDVPIVSNPGVEDADGSLRMRAPVDSPFYCPEVGVDKAGVVRWALDQFETVAFAGDGRPDEPAARLVDARTRFARGWLAERFVDDQTPFHPLPQWSKIADMLIELTEKR